MKMCYNQSIGSVRYKLLVQKITNSFHEPVIQTSFNLIYYYLLQVEFLYVWTTLLIKRTKPTKILDD